MPTRFNLFLIAGPRVTSSEVDALRYEGTSIGDQLAQWVHDGSDGEIELRVRPTVQAAQSGSASVDSARLQSLLNESISNQSSAFPAMNLALIFCRSWAGPATNVTGVMFDFTERVANGETPTFTDNNEVSREGAAVFLDPTRPDNDVVLTACHELGHVFNLIHDETGASFMTQGNGKDSVFSSTDQRALTRAGQKRWPYYERHLPGGENFRGEPFGVDEHPNEAGGSTRLQLSLAKDTFIVGEPIVADLHYRAGREDQQAAQFDPGFGTLRIWWEAPDGTRRRYVPCIHFCGKTYDDLDHLTLDNNLRVHFGQRGLSFTQPGQYLLWADYRPYPKKKRIRSQSVNFAVHYPISDVELDLSSEFCCPQISRFLAFKGGPISRRNLRQLKLIGQEYPDHPFGKHSRYSLAGWYVRVRQKKRARALLEGLEMGERSLQARVEQLRSELT